MGRHCFVVVVIFLASASLFFGNITAAKDVHLAMASTGIDHFSRVLWKEILRFHLTIY